MADIERRLKALENRARIDDERWQAANAQRAAFSMIINNIGAPICAADPRILPVIIANLSTSESWLRKQNEHDAAIRQIRYAREFFESLVSKDEKGASPPSKDGPSRPRK